MPTYKNKEFLSKIGQIESNSGQNLDHPMIHEGLQAGTSAIGKYGLMPNTVKELVNRRRVRGTSTPELQSLGQMNPDQMKAYIEANPGLEEDLANELATKVITRQQGDPDRAAYSWKQGDNLKPDQISDEQLDANPYVQKFRRLNQMLNPKPDTPEEDQDDEQ